MATHHRTGTPRSARALSLQPHAKSVIPPDVYRRKMSPLMTQSISKAGVSLLENFVVDGWAGSRPNSSAQYSTRVQHNRRHVVAHRPNNSSTATTAKGAAVRRPKKPAAGSASAIPRRRLAPRTQTNIVSQYTDPYFIMKDGEPTLETVHPHPRSTAAKEIPSIETPETSASLPTATNIHINTNTDTDTDTDTATISTVDTIHKKPLSEILPVFQLQRPLPEFRLPSNDRSIQVMTVQFQRQLRKQGKLMQKQINQLNRSHEVDLANVVLAYDTRMETLENRMDVRKSNNSKLNTMLEQAQQLLRDQKNQVKILQKKIKIQHDAMKASVHHHRHSGGSHHSPLIIGLSSPDALLTNSHEMWTSRDSPNGSGGRVSFDGDFHSTGAGGNRRDSNLSDWGNNNDRRSSGMVGMHNARDVDPTEMLRMREEIQQYQEALAEASKTIETMESRFVDQTNTQQEKQDDERVIDTMKHLQRRASNTEDALKTEQRIRIRMEAELERAKNGILELETTN